MEEWKICHWQILHCITVITLVHEFLISSPKKLIELGGCHHMAGELLGRWLGAFGWSCSSCSSAGTALCQIFSAPVLPFLHFSWLLLCLKGTNAIVVLGLGGRRGVELTGWSSLSATGLPIHQANVTMHFAMLGLMVFFWSFYTNLFLSTSVVLLLLHLLFIPQDDRPCSMGLGKITLISYGKWYELLFFGLCVQVSEEKVWIKCGRQA